MFKRLIRYYRTPLSSLALMVASFPLHATIVELQLSNEQSIQINLFDETTPETVENFLTYVESGAYTDAIMHRSIPGFIIQGGGFTFDGSEMQAIPANSPVINEPIYSNVRGTIAMAKLGSDENSATNQWFFNVADNSSNLDLQNGGFSVFGQVVENDIAKVDELVALSRCTFTSPFDNLPVMNFDCAGTADLATENLVTINQVIIIDSSTVTDADLTPTPNTLINSDSDDNNESGGSIYWLLGLLISGFTLRRAIR